MKTKIFPRKSGDIFATPGGTLYVAIAPCCLIYDRSKDPRWNQKGQQIIPAKIWAEVLTCWDNFQTQLLHYPLHRLFPTWVVKEYCGGSIQDYIGEVGGSSLLTLWWVKNYSLSLNYQPFIELQSNSDLRKAA